MNSPPSLGFSTAEASEARRMFRDRLDSLENDLKRCYWPLSEPAAPGPAFFPAVMYCFATLDYFSSFWAGSNRTAPKGQTQTDRMGAFLEKFLYYARRESQIALHFWRHKLMHTAEPRMLRNKVTKEEYGWSTGKNPKGHMQLTATGTGVSMLHFCPFEFLRDMREGVFGPSGYFFELLGEASLQQNYRACGIELESYEIEIKP